jgi:hypothetical protein
MTCNLPIYIKRESQFVGIGTNQPGAALHVQGDIILAGQMFNAEGEPFSLGGGGGAWKSRTSNLPLLVAPGAGNGGVIQVLSNVCLQKYGGNDNAYNIYSKALVVNAPTNREADYKISLPDMLKPNVYAPDTVIGEFWLTTTSNNESMTYKAVASVLAAEYDFATVRFLSGTTSVSFGHIGAGNVIELNGILAYATDLSINAPPSDSIYIPAVSVQWMEVAFPNPNVFGVGATDFFTSARKGMVRYVGDDIAYRIDVTGYAQNSAALTNNYALALPYPIQLSSYSTNAIVGDLTIRITNSFSTTIYRAYARVLAHTDSAVELRYINGTHDSSLYDIDVGSTIVLQGTLQYKSAMTASVAIPYSYIPNSLTQDTQGNIGIGTSLTPAKLTVGGDINFTGSLYQNGVAFVSGSGSSTFGTTQVVQHAFGGLLVSVTGNYYVGVRITWENATTSDSARAHLSGKCSISGNDSENAYRKFETIIDCKNDVVDLKPKGIANGEANNFYTTAFAGLTHVIERSAANAIDVQVRWTSSLQPYVTTAVFEFVAPESLGAITYTNINGVF